MAKDIDLNKLIVSRMCHDFANPLGAISNGFELLEMTTTLPVEESGLINDSIKAAKSRLDIFRLAYGRQKSTVPFGAEKFSNLLKSWNHESRLKIAATDIQETSYKNAQLAILVLQAMETAMPMGDNANLSLNAVVGRITAEGRKTAVKPALWEPLEKGNAPIVTMPTDVQFPLIAAILEEKDSILILKHTDTTLDARF